MAFKSTLNRSHFRLVREIEAMGANTSASASREQMGYTIDALKTYVPEMVEVLIDSVRNPAFLDWEVNEEVIMSCCINFTRIKTKLLFFDTLFLSFFFWQLRKVNVEIGELAKNPMGFLLEAVHSAGYSGALANPLYAPESFGLTGDILEEFVSVRTLTQEIIAFLYGIRNIGFWLVVSCMWLSSHLVLKFQENYTAARMVLAASGVDHEELLKVVEPLLSDLPNVTRPAEPKSQYVGGDFRQHTGGEVII